MCIVVFGSGVDDVVEFVLVNNRDEDLRRDTTGPSVSGERRVFFPGTDLRAGGTWHAVNFKTGRCAVLTNVTPLAILQADDNDAKAKDVVSLSNDEQAERCGVVDETKGKKVASTTVQIGAAAKILTSRGLIVRSEVETESEDNTLISDVDLDNVSGFNMITFNLRAESNNNIGDINAPMVRYRTHKPHDRDDEMARNGKSIESGQVHGFSNGGLNEWRKVDILRSAITDILENNKIAGDTSIEEEFNSMESIDTDTDTNLGSIGNDACDNRSSFKDVIINQVPKFVKYVVVMSGRAMCQQSGSSQQPAAQRREAVCVHIPERFWATRTQTITLRYRDPNTKERFILTTTRDVDWIDNETPIPAIWRGHIEKI